MWGRGVVLSGLLLTLVGCGGGVNWSMAQTAQVRVRSDLGPELTRDNVVRFQSVHDVLENNAFDCKLEHPLPRIEVTLLSADQYDALRPGHSGGFFVRNSFAWVAGLQDHIVVRDSDWVPNERIFQHELTHRFVAACFPAAPVWLHEGLASYFETLELQDGVLNVGVAPYVMSDFAYRPLRTKIKGRPALMVAAHRLPKVAELIRLASWEFYVTGESDEAHDRTAYNYAAAWALVHLLMLGEPSFAKPFEQYLRLLRDPSTDSIAAFERAFEPRVLQSRFERYLLKPGTQPVHEQYVSSVEAPKPRQRAMTPAESELHAAWLWTTVGAPKAKIDPHLVSALHDAEQRVRAKTLEALLAAGAGDLQRARTLLRETEAAEPNNLDLTALAIQVEVEDLRQRHTVGAQIPQVPLARIAELTQKLRSRAQSADTLRALAVGELVLGDKAAALQHINRAIDLYPSAWGSRVERARICAAQQLGECALAELGVALNLVPHDATRAREGILQMERQMRQHLKLPAAAE